MVFIHCFSAKPKKCISYTCKCIYSGVGVRNIMSIYVLRVALRAVIQFQWGTIKVKTYFVQHNFFGPGKKKKKKKFFFFTYLLQKNCITRCRCSELHIYTAETDEVCVSCCILWSQCFFF